MAQLTHGKVEKNVSIKIYSLSTLNRSENMENGRWSATAHVHITAPCQEARPRAEAVEAAIMFHAWTLTAAFIVTKI